MVLLPLPEAPTMPTDFPLLILKLMLRRTGLSDLLAYENETLLNSMTTVASFSSVSASLIPVEVLIGG